MLFRSIHQVAVSDTIQLTGKGLSVNTEDNSNMSIADDKGIMLALKNLNNYIDILQQEMIFYIETEHDKYLANPATGYNYADVKFIIEGSKYVQPNVSERKIMMRY